MSTDAPNRLTLVQAADRLNMKKSNVRKFLVRHGVEPLEAKAQGHWWDGAQIDALARRRAEDKDARAADEKRRASALALAEQRRAIRSAIEGLGPREREVLDWARNGQQLPDKKSMEAARRLRKKGLLEPMPDAVRRFRLTAEAERAVR